MRFFAARMMRDQSWFELVLPFRLVLTAVAVAVIASASIHAASADNLPPHQIIAEEAGDKRRAVSVRVAQRLDQADAVRLAIAIHARSKPTTARSFVNFFLPGVPLNQGAWASVVFSPEPKFLAHGLKREDEQLLLAEHRADTRHLLGSWLTPPPAAIGRLTIYSDFGRIYAEWRLKSGEKTVDELRDRSTAMAGRRFDVVGGDNSGAHYLLTRSGDLEIWAGSTLVAVAERIRVDTVTPTAQLSPSASSAPSVQTSVQLSPNLASRASAAPNSSVVLPPQVGTTDAAAPSRAGAGTSPRTMPSNFAAPPAATTTQSSPAKARTRTRIAENARPTSDRSRRQKTLTTGDQIAAKFAGTM